MKPQDSDKLMPSAPARKHILFEPVALVLLSLATVGTAWSSFEAAAWGGASQRGMNLSAASDCRAVTDELQSSRMALLDVLPFSQHINARASSNEMLARFYAERFRGKAKSAFDAWMSTKPCENPNALAHPFVTNLYHQRLLAEAALAEAENQQVHFVEARSGVRERLRREGLNGRLGGINRFTSVADVVGSLQKTG